MLHSPNHSYFQNISKLQATSLTHNWLVILVPSDKRILLADLIDNYFALPANPFVVINYFLLQFHDPFRPCLDNPCANPLHPGSRSAWPRREFCQVHNRNPELLEQLAGCFQILIGFPWETANNVSRYSNHRDFFPNLLDDLNKVL